MLHFYFYRKAILKFKNSNIVSQWYFQNILILIKYDISFVLLKNFKKISEKYKTNKFRKIKKIKNFK